MGRRDDGFWRDLCALLRSLPFAGRVPGVRRRAAGYLAGFDRVVAPIVAAAVPEPGDRARAAAVLRATSVKLGFLVAGYAAMARVPVRPDLLVLTGAITRVYDDLFDHFGGPELDDRLAELFRGGAFEPRGDMERLFLGLYREVERRLDRSPDAPHDVVFAALAAVHEHQAWSRGQADPEIGSAEIARITEGKGGHGMVVLLSLATPPMSRVEADLVYELGAILQRLDDYQDAEPDAATGVATAATRGEATLDDIRAALRGLAPRLRAHYGSERPLYAVLHATLWMSFARRRCPNLGRVLRGFRTPLAVLLRRAGSLADGKTR
ncbi:hypothetical protein [Actinokineospora iranica]|uniref:Phytoene synthase n=1 Tax=Actinokineospora iranica TaxID=1271860 RepID=A0A1G6U366_9PSEU|nr:hypothetical protein [Actinokineospora iranica]SDD35731.1 hypothetical protein SAMN05216174_11081 [Actinokineospora iranica]